MSYCHENQRYEFSLNIKYDQLPWKFMLRIEIKHEIFSTAMKI